MKKITLLLLIMVLVLSGCGHKSNSELVDIEQFKCQDSIQTVFDVLGKTDMETSSFIGEYYEYDNLNLWGYDGYAIFRVRDNKETISSFECTLTLNDNEFKELLSRFSDKYGSYEVSNYTNQTAYTWEFSEDEAVELGYNRLSISYYGDKKYTVKFSDEWSIYKDEAYYEHLEEEEKINVLAEKTYNIGEDTFNFSFGQKGNGDYSFNLICQIADKTDAFSTHISLNAIMNSDDDAIKSLTDDMNFSYCIIIGDGSMIMRAKSILYAASKDGEPMNIDDYFSQEWLISEEYRESDYGTQVTNFMVDFIENE